VPGLVPFGGRLGESLVVTLPCNGSLGYRTYLRNKVFKKIKSVSKSIDNLLPMFRIQLIDIEFLIISYSVIQ